MFWSVNALNWDWKDGSFCAGCWNVSVKVGNAFVSGVNVGGDLFSGLFVLETPFCSFPCPFVVGVEGGGGGCCCCDELSGFSHGR